MLMTVLNLIQPILKSNIQIGSQMCIKKFKEIKENFFHKPQKTNETEELTRLESSLKEFLDCNDFTQAIDSHSAYETLDLVHAMLIDHKTSEESLKIVLKLKIHEHFADIFEHLCSIQSQLNFKETKPMLNDPNVCYISTDLNERRIFNLFNLDSILNHVMQFNIEFSKYLCKLSNDNKTYLKVFLILFCLYRRSINQNIKLNIFKSENFAAYLKKLIYKGIEIEKQYALQLLAHLAFNAQVNKEINEDADLNSSKQ